MKEKPGKNRETGKPEKAGPLGQRVLIPPWPQKKQVKIHLLFLLIKPRAILDFLPLSESFSGKGG